MISFSGTGLVFASKFLVQFDMELNSPFALVLETEARDGGPDGFAMIFPP